MPETTVNSFIIRFVQDKASQNDSNIESWHATIRHVQSSEELRFTQIEDALKFMADYVAISGPQASTGNLIKKGPDDMEIRFAG